MSSVSPDIQWFVAKKGNVGRTLQNAFAAIDNDDNTRYHRLNTYRNYYRDRNVEGTTPWAYRQTSSNEPVPENMLRPLVDTLTAKLIRNRPRVTAATIGGGLEARRRARNLSLFWDGVWEQNRLHARLSRYVREALVTGDGVWHVRIEQDVTEKKGKICIDLVSVSELYIDDIEAFYGQPRNLYRRRYVDRTWLQSRFPSKAKAIAAAAPADTDTNKITGPTIDLVEVVEGWHLPTRKGQGDGKYVMVVGDVVLKEAEWLYESFPFVRFSPSPPMACDGYWGTGMVESLLGAQLQLSETANTVNTSQRMLGHPWIFLPEQAQVNPRHMKNIPAVMVDFKGNTPPIIATPDPVSRQMYQDVDNRRNKMTEDSGVSRMSLTSSKPTGFDPSGRAIQEMADVETERFMELGRALEESMIELAQWTVWMAQELDDMLEGGFKMVARDGREALELKWSDVSLKQDAFVMHVESTAWQGRSIPGRIADVERLANSGAITDPVILAKMLGMPDVDAYLEEAGSPRDVVEMMAEIMLSTGRFIPPEPFMPIEQSLLQMQMIYLREVAKRKGADDERLELLRRWMGQAAGMLQAQQPPQPQLPAEDAAAPVDAGVEAGSPDVGGLPPVGPEGAGLPVAG